MLLITFVNTTASNLYLHLLTILTVSIMRFAVSITCQLCDIRKADTLFLIILNNYISAVYTYTMNSLLNVTHV